MSIDTTSCSFLAIPGITILICVGLAGVILGLGLSLVVLMIDTQLQRKQQRKRHLEEEAVQRLHKQEQETTIAQRELEQATIDCVMDERMVCSVCWQERHPGMQFPLPGFRLCREHSRRFALENVFSVDRDQVLISDSRAMEEICA